MDEEEYETFMSRICGVSWSITALCITKSEISMDTLFIQRQNMKIKVPVISWKISERMDQQGNNSQLTESSQQSHLWQILYGLQDGKKCEMQACQVFFSFLFSMLISITENLQLGKYNTFHLHIKSPTTPKAMLRNNTKAVNMQSLSTGADMYILL